MKTLKTYLVTIEIRDGDFSIMGPYLSFEEARQDVCKQERIFQKDFENFEDYGSDWDEGVFCSEEQTIEIIEGREINI